MRAADTGLSPQNSQSKESFQGMADGHCQAHQQEPAHSAQGCGGAEAVRRRLADLGINEVDVADAVNWARNP